MTVYIDIIVISLSCQETDELPYSIDIEQHFVFFTRKLQNIRYFSQNKIMATSKIFSVLWPNNHYFA